MILTLVGLVFSFIGSISLVWDVLFSFGKPRTIFTPIYLKENKIKYIRLEPKNGEGYKKVKISKEEIKTIVSLSLLSLGFLLQILDFIC